MQFLVRMKHVRVLLDLVRDLVFLSMSYSPGSCVTGTRTPTRQSLEESGRRWLQLSPPAVRMFTHLSKIYALMIQHSWKQFY